MMPGKETMIPLACGVLFCMAFGCSSNAPQEGASSSLDRPLGSTLSACALCHSTKEAQRGPILHGMDAWYLLAQIQKFHTGIRGQNPKNRSEHLMGVAIRKIGSKQEMTSLSQWFANQKPMPAIPTVRGDLANGKILYATRCASCHGEKAEGKRELSSPSLSQLEGWYFLDQMRKFRSGMRGKHPLDTAGQAMVAAVADFSPAQLRDVVAFAVDAFGLPKAPSSRKPLPRRPIESNASRE
ncbi:MAG: c-type cytochrome [Opitutales bacterium]|jgi:cytochrome c553